jgi:hypothetical protein
MKIITSADDGFLGGFLGGFFDGKKVFLYESLHK